jgi:hypothetical protein
VRALKTAAGIRRRVFQGILVLSLGVFASSFGLAFAESQTVTFDDIQNQDLNSPLEGQYPAGVIDWGDGAWYLSGPWQAINSNSVSFNGDGISNASFNFLSPHQLVRLDAYNGDTDPSTLTLSCAGQTDKRVQLNGNEMRTIDTGWNGTCASVGISTSNGWQVNFKNLVVQSFSDRIASTPAITYGLVELQQRNRRRRKRERHRLTRHRQVIEALDRFRLLRAVAVGSDLLKTRRVVKTQTYGQVCI